MRFHPPLYLLFSSSLRSIDLLHLSSTTATADDLVIEVADLPFLDAKAEYLHDFTPADILDSTCPTISLDDSDSSHQTGPNTVSSLRAKLAALYADGTASGFPIVAIDESEPSTSSLSRSQQPPRRVYGYIAAKELEHGLALATARGLGEDAAITFKTASAAAKGLLSAAAGGGGRGTAMQSGAVTPTFRDNGGGVVGGALESMDLGWLSDSAPITVSVRSSIELLHEVRPNPLPSLLSFPLHPFRLRLTRTPSLTPHRCSSNSASGASSSSTNAVSSSARSRRIGTSATCSGWRSGMNTVERRGGRRRREEEEGGWRGCLSGRMGRKARRGGGRGGGDWRVAEEGDATVSPHLTSSNDDYYDPSYDFRMRTGPRTPPFLFHVFSSLFVFLVSPSLPLLTFSSLLCHFCLSSRLAASYQCPASTEPAL